MRIAGARHARHTAFRSPTLFTARGFNDVFDRYTSERQEPGEDPACRAGANSRARRACGGVWGSDSSLVLFARRSGREDVNGQSFARSAAGYRVCLGGAYACSWLWVAR